MEVANIRDFAREYEKLESKEFIKKASFYLKDINSKDDILNFIYILEHALKTKTVEVCDDLTELCLLLRGKIYDILLSKGDMFENNVIFLYAYFSKCELPEDLRLGAYETFVNKNLYSEGVSEIERVFLINIRFFASFVNSKPYALEEFIESTFLLHYIQVSDLRLLYTLRSFFEDVKIDIEITFKILEKLYSKDFYFSIDPVQRRSILNWSFYCLWVVPNYLNHPLWGSFYKAWKEILFEHVKRDECDEAMYMHFYIYHKMGNRFQTQEEWRMFNDEIDMPMSAYYKEFADRVGLVKCKPVQSEGKKIIGFLWDRLVENSPFKIAYSLWKALYDSHDFRDKFEIRVYVMSYFEKSDNTEACVKLINGLGIKMFDGASPFQKEASYHSHLKKAIYIREKMINDGVDIMIHGSSYDITDFLVATRTAPKQIYWSHGNAMFNVDGVDMTISHCNFNDSCQYRFFEAPMDKIFLNPSMPIELINKERTKYPKDVFILGTIGRLVKLNSDEYLQTVAKIMEENKNTIYIAAGVGSVEAIKEKLVVLGISDRFYFPGLVDAHIYGHIIDLWLNTFPHYQGQSTQEFESKGKPTLTINYNAVFEKDTPQYDDVRREYNELINRHDVQKYMKANGIPDDIMEWNDYVVLEFATGQDIERYISKASFLIQNEELRNKLGILNKMFCEVLLQKSKVEDFVKCIKWEK